MLQPEFLTAKDLMNNLYCERITYFEHVLKIPQRTTRKELEGRVAHEKFDEKSKRLKILPGVDRMPRIYNLFLEDTDRGFRTIIDCLLIDRKKNEAFVIQVKNSPKPSFVYEGQRFQLIAEAFLVRKAGYSVQKAYVKYLKDDILVPVDVGPDTEPAFVARINRIRDIIEKEIMPEPTGNKKKCADCCFLKLCRRV